MTLKVDQTANLRSLQLIHVSWSGAHPTGGLVADTNSDLAQNEEYSFALFECRGTDSATHPLTPNTCWTQYADERFAYGYDSYPAWRSDSAATPRQRAAFVGAPEESADGVCQHAVPDRQSALGAVHRRGQARVRGRRLRLCRRSAGGEPGELHRRCPCRPMRPSESLAPTARGQAAFDVFTDEDHQSLGCSAMVRVLARRRTDRGGELRPGGYAAARGATSDRFGQSTTPGRTASPRATSSQDSSCPPKGRARPRSTARCGGARRTGRTGSACRSASPRRTTSAR